jgi:hypothetical protein
MAKVIRYQRIDKLLPREGVNYSTSYVKQTLEQRKELCKHIKSCVSEIAEVIEQDDDWSEFIRQPLKGFKTTKYTNRSVLDIIQDMVNEAKGKQLNNLPKDFALAPIERWNKLFKDTPYEIVLTQTFNRVNNFSDLMEFNDDTD